MALTSRCGLRRRAGPTGSTCGEAAFLHGKGPEVRAHVRPARTLCARPLTLRRAASPQPALTRLPSSLGRSVPWRRHHARRHHARRLRRHRAHRHHAHRHHVQRCLARWDPRAAASCATAPRSMRSICLVQCERPVGSRESDTPAMRLPAQAATGTRLSVHRCAALCTLSSEHVSLGEPCRVLVWPTCGVFSSSSFV